MESISKVNLGKYSKWRLLFWNFRKRSNIETYVKPSTLKTDFFKTNFKSRYSAPCPLLCIMGRKISPCMRGRDCLHYLTSISKYPKSPKRTVFWSVIGNPKSWPQIWNIICIFNYSITIVVDNIIIYIIMAHPKWSNSSVTVLLDCSCASFLKLSIPHMTNSNLCWVTYEYF